MSGISDMTRRSLANVQATLQRAQQGGSLHELALEAVVVVSNIRGEIDESAPELREFAESITQYGVQEPILVRPSKKGDGKFELIAGERRWRASRLAGRATVPAIVKHVDDDDFFMLQVVENIHRENISQLKEAEALKQAMERFGGLDAVAKKWNRSKAWVSERLQLLDLKPGARQLIEDSVTADVAVINSVNRAEKLDAQAGQDLAQRVRRADKKREVARQGLDEVKGRAGAKSGKAKESVVPADWGREAAKLAGKLASALQVTTPDIDLKRQVKTTLGEADKRAAAVLRKALEAAHGAGVELAKDWQSGLGASLSMLAAQLDAEATRGAAGRALILKAFALGAMEQPYDFETIVVS